MKRARVGLLFGNHGTEIEVSSNWRDFFNKNSCYVMFSKSDCEQCKILETSLEKVNLNREILMTKLVLDTPGFAELKQKYSWISNIDVLPYNAIFSKGRLIESWSGANLDTLQTKINGEKP